MKSQKAKSRQECRPGTQECVRHNVGIWVGALAVVWGYAVFQWGGVVGLDRKIFLLALGVVGAAWCVVNGRRAARLPGLAGRCWWMLPAYAALQLAPAPRWLLGVVSPARAELARALDPVGLGETTSTLSVAPGIGMNQFLLIAGYAMVFFLAYQLACDGRRAPWVLVLPMVTVAALEALLGFVQALEGQTVAGTYVNRDHFAGLLEMALPFALAYPIAQWRSTDTRREFPMRLAVAMSAGLGAAALMLTGSLSSLSRMGVMAALFGVLVMGIVAWRGSGWRAVGIVGLLAVGLAACFVFLPSDALIARFAAAGDDLTAEGRTRLWAESLALVRRFPVFGCGLGGYESAFLRYKVSVPMVSDDRVHNDYLQFLIELGVVGFAIGAVLMGSIVGRAWRAASQGEDVERRWLAIGCVGAFAAIGLHSLVDFNLYVPANAMLLAWISGVALSNGDGAERVHDWRDAGLGVTIDVAAEKG